MIKIKKAIVYTKPHYKTEWNKSKNLKISGNIILTHILPYTSKMNPIEQIWKQIRQMGFGNKIFKRLNAVVNKLCDTIAYCF